MIRLRAQSKVLIVRPDALAGNIINGQDACMCSQLCMPVKMDLRRDGCMQKRVVQPVWVLSSAIFSIQLILLWRSRHCLSTMLRSTLPSNHARPLLRIIRTRLPRFEGLLVGTSTVSATVVVRMSGDGAASRLLKLLLDLLRAFSIATLDCSGMFQEVGPGSTLIKLTSSSSGGNAGVMTRIPTAVKKRIGGSGCSRCR